MGLGFRVLGLRGDFPYGLGLRPYAPASLGFEVQS